MILAIGSLAGGVLFGAASISFLKGEYLLAAWYGIVSVALFAILITEETL